MTDQGPTYLYVLGKFQAYMLDMRLALVFASETGTMPLIVLLFLHMWIVNVHWRRNISVSLTKRIIIEKASRIKWPDRGLDAKRRGQGDPGGPQVLCRYEKTF